MLLMQSLHSRQQLLHCTADMSDNTLIQGSAKRSGTMLGCISACPYCISQYILTLRVVPAATDPPGVLLAALLLVLWSSIGTYAWGSFATT